MAVAYLGLGTNLGDRKANLAAALERLTRFVTIEAVSSVYESEPVGFREQGDFWNLVVRTRTELGPHALMRRILALEQAMGRTRSFPSAPRVIDVDILLYDDRVVDAPSLRIPHPRMLGRAFVLRPLAELAPELRHPVAGRTIRDLLDSAPDLERAEPILPGDSLLPDR